MPGAAGGIAVEGGAAGAAGDGGGSISGPAPEAGKGMGSPSDGGGGAGATTTSLAIAVARPYSIAAINGTTSQRWETPQRMKQPIGIAKRHYM
jgi:hypothetical protein